MDNLAPEAVQNEKQRRQAMWDALPKDGSSQITQAVPPDVLRNLRVYGGAQGCWVDVENTRLEQPYGTTVGVLHTGRHYADDLGDDGITYHYPSTRRQAGRDTSEIEATKNCSRFDLPLFVVTQPNDKYRQVRRGWVTAWSDEQQAFFISFVAPEVGPPLTDEDFKKVDDTQLESAWRKTLKRVGGRAFRFATFARYGRECVFCPIRRDEALDAMHVKGHAETGPMHELNGLPGCKTHHVLFDSGLILIHPNTLAIECGEKNETLQPLGVTKQSLCSLPATPYMRWRGCEGTAK